MTLLARLRWKHARATLLLAAALALLGCSLVPETEFSLYRQSFAAANRATSDVLDAYNRAEKRTAAPGIEAFDPDQAGLIAPDADAPMTAFLRRGFEAVETYNAILARYAAGDSLSVLKGDFDALDRSLDRLGLAVGAAPQAEGIRALVQAGTTVARLALARSDDLAFRQSVAENGATVRGFLLALRAQTPLMYRTFTNAAMTGVASPADIQRAQASIQYSREMLASWVLLLDETAATLEALEQAVETGSGRASGIAILAASTDRLARHAEDVRFTRRRLSEAF